MSVVACMMDERISFKGPAHSKNENLYFLVPAQTKRMQPILVLCMTLRLVALV